MTSHPQCRALHCFSCCCSPSTGHIHSLQHGSQVPWKDSRVPSFKGISITENICVRLGDAGQKRETTVTKKSVQAEQQEKQIYKRMFHSASCLRILCRQGVTPPALTFWEIVRRNFVEPRMRCNEQSGRLGPQKWSKTQQGTPGGGGTELHACISHNLTTCRPSLNFRAFIAQKNCNKK